MQHGVPDPLSERRAPVICTGFPSVSSALSRFSETDCVSIITVLTYLASRLWGMYSGTRSGLVKGPEAVALCEWVASFWAPFFSILVIWLWVAGLPRWGWPATLRPVESVRLQTCFCCFLHHSVHKVSGHARFVGVVKMDFLYVCSATVEFSGWQRSKCRIFSWYYGLYDSSGVSYTHLSSLIRDAVHTGFLKPNLFSSRSPCVDNFLLRHRDFRDYVLGN
jgi:hypothetical protein